MVVLTLVGTVATVVSVLLAMGIGPFDLSADKDGKTSAPVAPVANGSGGAQTLEGWVAKVNEVCGKETSEFTNRLQAKDAALDAGDLPGYAAELAQLSRRMDGIVTQLKAVPLPEDGDAEQWREAYIKRSELLAESAAHALAMAEPGTAEADVRTSAEMSDAKLAELDTLDNDEIKPLAEKLGVSCP
ncbi:hypothetical protein [Yinghuangia sp. YIM S09857]|uniref:hypothetical protein n=1 Tax=Yinghuangia sp. YIM S09857 TaxID=3436929 RepID=UPI003F53A5D7